MKKILLLALTIFSAASLTACTNEPTINNEDVETVSLFSSSKDSKDIDNWKYFENYGLDYIELEENTYYFTSIYIGGINTGVERFEIEIIDHVANDDLPYEFSYYDSDEAISKFLLFKALKTQTSTCLFGYESMPVYTIDYLNSDLSTLSATININDNKSLSDILIDLDLSSATILSDGYTSNRNVVGTHQVIVIDGSVETTININVVDTAAPVISGINSYTTNTETKLSITDIKNKLTITDNTSEQLDIVVKNDYYSSNWNSTGTYSIIFSATDSSGNSSEYIVTVYVNDIVAPVISGPTNYIKNPNVILTAGEILNNLSASDNIDGNLTSSIVVKSDGYTGKASAVGNYSIVFEVTDTAGNSTQHTVRIEVSTSIANFYMYDNSTIVIYDNVKLDNNDFVTLLKKLGLVGTSSGATNQYVIAADNYYNNSSKEGEYVITYLTSSSDGTSYTGSLNVIVVDSGGMSSDQNSLGFADSIKNFLINLGAGITSFFSGLGSFFLSKWYLFLIPIVGVIAFFYQKKK